MVKENKITIPLCYRPAILKAVRLALIEDIGPGDITTKWTVPVNRIVSGEIIAKESGVVAGLAVAAAVFNELEKLIRFFPRVHDGELVKAGKSVAFIEGPAQAILSGERTALNFMQRMSGIATYTRSLVDAIAHTDCKVLDTRKTAPGLRAADKWSVALGGGENHRTGLYDMVLIKENHINAAGGIRAAVESILKNIKGDITIEIEVRNLMELDEALLLPVNRILLDNMSLSDIRQARKRAGDHIQMEASGNVTLETIVPIANTGVDFVSVGALTHSVQAMDMSLIILS